MKTGKLILYIALSMDGYISRENGAIDWLQGHGDMENPDYGYEQFLATIDTVVMGWKTYHQVVTELSPEAWVYPNQEALVVTRQDVTLPSGQVVIHPDQQVAAVKERLAAGKNVWLIGGAQTAQAFIEANLVDEYVLTIIPILLGSGIRLFQHSDTEIPLRLVQHQVLDGMVMLTYHRR